MADDRQACKVVYGMSLCPAGTSLLADDDPLLLHWWEAELRGRHVAHMEVYLAPLQNGKVINQSQI